MPPRRIVDPTGVGDAFRGGLMKGMAAGASLQMCAQLGSVAATYALEHLGGQSHAYTLDEFTTRYEAHFGPLESNIRRSDGPPSSSYLVGVEVHTVGRPSRPARRGVKPRHT